jgi:hypothetical protein
MDLTTLATALPGIRKWIGDTIAQHEQAARSVESFGFTRLACHYSAEPLAAARVVVVDTIPKPPLTAIGLTAFKEFEEMVSAGITYLNHYFLRRGRENDESLHFHELVHTVQWQTLGPVDFLVAYACGHLLHGGYESNPFELIAYELQRRFEGDGTRFGVERLVKSHLSQTLLTLSGGQVS